MRSAETSEQAAARRASNAARAAAARGAESPEQGAARRASNASRTAAARGAEAPEQAVARQRNDRERHARVRGAKRAAVAGAEGGADPGGVGQLGGDLLAAAVAATQHVSHGEPAAMSVDSGGSDSDGAGARHRRGGGGGDGGGGGSEGSGDGGGGSEGSRSSGDDSSTSGDSDTSPAALLDTCLASMERAFGGADAPATNAPFEREPACNACTAYQLRRESWALAELHVCGVCACRMPWGKLKRRALSSLRGLALLDAVPAQLSSTPMAGGAPPTPGGASPRAAPLAGQP